MTFVREANGKGVFRPSIPTLVPGKGGGDIITSIFADGTDGFYFDFSKTNRLFQDLVNTPADGAGENIWLGLESHSWGGKSLDGLIATQSEARGNGSIALLGTATAATYNTSTGDGTVSRVDASNQSYVTFSPAVGTHRLEIAVTGVAITVRNQTAAGTVLVASIAAGTTGVVYVNAASQIISINAQTVGTASFNVVSLKAIPGNHGLQATVNSQPKWQTGGIARADGSDDGLATTKKMGARGFVMAKHLTASAPASAKVLCGACGASTDYGYCGVDSAGKGVARIGSGAAMVSDDVVTGTLGTLGFWWDGNTAALLLNGVKVKIQAQSGAPTTAQALALFYLNNNGTPGSWLGTDGYRFIHADKAPDDATLLAIHNKLMAA